MDSQQERQQKRKMCINLFFFFLDFLIALGMCISSFIAIPQGCLMSFFLYYTIFFIGQAIQHFLMFKMPSMDAIKYDQTIKRLIFIIVIIQVTYMFLAFMFWAKADIHPIYCSLCGIMGLPLAIGALIAAHFVVSLFLFIHVVHAYVTRKYYLLALGGIDVEIKLNQQREEYLRRLQLLQPDYNDYPHPLIPQKSGKFYHFQDIPEDVEGEEVCSICLTRNKEGFHPIYTACRHFFHRQCLENWLKINSKCPECRRDFHKRQQIQAHFEIRRE